MINRDIESLFDGIIESQIEIENRFYRLYSGSFWTSKQRQSNALHEISYRACFKAELPNYFINRFTNPNEIVYDPFSGRGTTVLEASLLGRDTIANDINPLSKILSEPRLNPPTLDDIKMRLDSIEFDYSLKSDLDLSMFYDSNTLCEILTFRDILADDIIDKWIKMVATNRLSGHSKGFFSVYTLPPNQAVTPERQIKLNQKSGLIPEYRDTKAIILKKSKELLKNIDSSLRKRLNSQKSLFLTKDCRNTPEIESNSVNLIVTSPPFLDVIDYNGDNWLRNWFNKIESPNIANFKNLNCWISFITEAMQEFYRVLKPNSYLIFEVGEVKKAKIKLEEIVIPIAQNSGFKCESIIINSQNFTKTANIWNINNNSKGTNTNRILVLKKES